MCEIYTMSSTRPTKVTFSLGEFKRHGCDTGIHCDGWGLACFEGYTAEVYREPEAAALSLKMSNIMKYHQPSSLVISHIRKATQGALSLNNTQPFSMVLNDHHHVFVHNGDLINIQGKISLNKFQPKGETDSEYAFCYLMEKISELWEKGAPSLQQRTAIIKPVFDRFAKMGPANFIYCDGEYLFAYANKRRQRNGTMEPPGLHYLIRSVCSDEEVVEISGVDISEPNQAMVLFASVPLTKENWIPFDENQMLVVKGGVLVSY